jgi:hypothetical protein
VFQDVPQSGADSGAGTAACSDEKRGQRTPVSTLASSYHCRKSTPHIIVWEQTETRHGQQRTRTVARAL